MGGVMAPDRVDERRMADEPVFVRREFEADRRAGADDQRRFAALKQGKPFAASLHSIDWAQVSIVLRAKSSM
jgi:hypothetical protein